MNKQLSLRDIYEFEEYCSDDDDKNGQEGNIMCLNKFHQFVCDYAGHDNVNLKDTAQAFKAFNSKGGDLDRQEFDIVLGYLEDAANWDGNNRDKLCVTKQLEMAVKLQQRDRAKLLNSIVDNVFSFKQLLCVQQNGKDYDMESQVSKARMNMTTNPNDPEFDSPFSPRQMRCLAMVSHNGMKESMKEFVIQNQNVLKKFRLTGTNSTMTMIRTVFGDDTTVVYGPSCESGPLGGDAQLVAQMCDEELGGMIFFQDPMDSHPHSSDIACLNRQALIYNVPVAGNPASGLMLVNQLRSSLMGNQPENIPSFFFTLQCPSVKAYKDKQKQVISKRSADTPPTLVSTTSTASMSLSSSVSTMPRSVFELSDSSDSSLNGNIDDLTISEKEKSKRKKVKKDQKKKDKKLKKKKKEKKLNDAKVQKVVTPAA